MSSRQAWHARIVLPSAQPMYAAAARWRDEALIGDRSLFSGQPIDGVAAAQELTRDFIDRPDSSSRDFVAKLRDQLTATSAAGVQVAAELLFVHTLIVSTTSFKAKNKLELVNNVLAVTGEGKTPPEDLARALTGGAVSPGQAYATLRWKMLAYLIRVFEAVKGRPVVERQSVLTDWTLFQGLLSEIDDQSVWAQRYALEHLLFPELALPSLSRGDRAKIVGAFSSDLAGEALDVHQLVASLESNVAYGDRAGVDLYLAPYRERWQGINDKLARYAAWAWKVTQAVDLDHEERSFKLERVDRLRQVFATAEAGDDPADAFRRAFSGFGILDFRVVDSFANWVRDNTSPAQESLRELAHRPGPESIDRFLSLVPREAAAGLGAGLSIASALLFGLDPENLPPWRSEAADMTRRLTGGYQAEESATAGEHYLHFLERLDAIRAAASADGLQLRDRLDTQGLAWTIAKYKTDDLADWSATERAEFDAWRSGKPAPPVHELVGLEPKPPIVDVTKPTSLEELAADLSMPTTDWLEETLALWEDKRQLILQGPPGTGKTFIARQLARYLADDPARVTTVQFHPGTSYEDFVQGLRPDPTDPSRFAVVNGPLMRISQAAAKDPTTTYVLLIDEINRGNVPAVFGELYYLLEYRNERVTLLYGDDHTLPDNLFLIGTMNTADRSITALDAALRRRFYVRDLNPDSDLLRDILTTYLNRKAADLGWLADLLDRANTQLGDPDLAIGPSHFMSPGLTEVRARRAWNHSVLPTLREYFHSNTARLEAFDFDTLKTQLNLPDDTDTAAD